MKLKIFSQFAKSLAKYEKLTDAIDKVLWDESHGAWFDFDILENRKKSAFCKLHHSFFVFSFNFYPSNVYPLMIREFVKHSNHIEKYMKSSGALEFKGGIPSGLPAQSTQQWDFPNVWAPNQHFVIQSFLASNNSFLQQVSTDYMALKAYFVRKPADKQKHSLNLSLTVSTKHQKVYKEVSGRNMTQEAPQELPEPEEST